MPKLSEIISQFEKRIPLALQEKWDHCGLNLGSPSQNINSVLFSYDICKEVIAFAKKEKCQLIVSHHPYRMNAEVSLNLDSDEGQIIKQAIQSNIALYCAHTNHDASADSLNFHYLKKLGLQNIQALSPLGNPTFKLVTFVPQSHTKKVMNALFETGAGSIGEYDQCSFRVEGKGSFRGGAESNPTIGKPGQREEVQEDRLEVIVTDYNLSNTIKGLLIAHPYEEVAYDVIPLKNSVLNLGLGAFGELEKGVTKASLIKACKKLFQVKNVRYVDSGVKNIKRIGICTGSGASFIDKALSLKLDLFITGDVKYHQAIHAKRHGLNLLDVGHFHSEKDSVKILKQVFEQVFQNKLKYQTYTKLKDAFEFL